MRIEKQIDELTKEVFGFWVRDNIIILDSYYLMSKENKRKKIYNITKTYRRIMDRNNNITLDEVPFTDEIKKEVLDNYITTLKVMNWNEFNNNKNEN